MSKLKELIDRLCPNGVEFKPLGELGTFFGGLTGKSKDDFKDGNAKFITYVNIYSNPALNIYNRKNEMLSIRITKCDLGKTKCHRGQPRTSINNKKS